MKKLHSLPTLVFTAVLCGTAHAQVQLYGVLDLAVGQLEWQPPGAPNAPIVQSRGVHSGIMQNSFFGLRGSEDLGGGLTAKFQLESFIRADTGQSGRFDATPTSGADFQWSKEAFVGLAGGFGEIRLGNNTSPFWISMVQTSALSTNSSFSPSFRQLFNGGTRGKTELDSALVNSVKYNSPNFAGIEAMMAVQARESRGTGNNYSANLAYRNGPLSLNTAIMSVNHAADPNLPAVRDQTTYLLGGAYDFKVVKAFVQYISIKNDRLNTRDKMPQVGFTAPVGAGVVQFSTGQDKTSGAITDKRTTTSLGYVYSLSKRTEVYSFVMTDKLTVGTANNYVAGIRHRF